MYTMKTTTAIQGIKGSFHHVVAMDYFPQEIELLECLSFDSLVDTILNGAAKQAVMALENSIAGSIIPNYALIDQNDLSIVGLCARFERGLCVSCACCRFAVSGPALRASDFIG